MRRIRHGVATEPYWASTPRARNEPCRMQRASNATVFMKRSTKISG